MMAFAVAPPRPNRKLRRPVGFPRLSTSAALVTLGLISCALTPAFADSFATGNQLYRSCLQNALESESYIRGLSDAFQIVNGPQGKFPRICMRVGMSGDQVRDVVCNYLRDNPQYREDDAASLAFMALTGAFPCAQQ